MESKDEKSKWFRIALANLLIVATLGVLMRYKIAFALPFVDQKHLLHAHSHFAFAGWITQALMVLLTGYLSISGLDAFKKYKWLLIANLITAYGMLCSFPFQGYGPISIAFSTLSILVFYSFAVSYWRDLTRTDPGSISAYWFKAALVFGILSSTGVFALSYMMATKSIDQHLYLASVYFYLHFQYNGWFFFACMGLFSYLIREIVSNKTQRMAFVLFAAACLPAYVLSALWLPLPEWVHTIVSIAAVAQIVAWVILVYGLWKVRSALREIVGKARWILLLVAMALSIKLSLQLGSTIHFLSDLAFGFRPIFIVIGYLHLVLLGVITLFILGYAITQDLLDAQRKLTFALSLFIGGIILNELLLMIQGIAAIGYIAIPYVNEALLAVAILMFGGILGMNIAAFRRPENSI